MSTISEIIEKLGNLPGWAMDAELRVVDGEGEEVGKVHVDDISCTPHGGVKVEVDTGGIYAAGG